MAYGENGYAEILLGYLFFSSLLVPAGQEMLRDKGVPAWKDDGAKVSVASFACPT